MMLVLPVLLSPRRTILKVLLPIVEEVIDISDILKNYTEISCNKVIILHLEIF
jgi:hypothetical protein